MPRSKMTMLDGDVLNDRAWHYTKPATDFWQTQPNEGQLTTGLPGRSVALEYSRLFDILD